MGGWLALLQLPHHLAGLLGDPGGIGMIGAARQIDPAHLQLNKEQHVYRL